MQGEQTRVRLLLELSRPWKCFSRHLLCSVQGATRHVSSRLCAWAHLHTSERSHICSLFQEIPSDHGRHRGFSKQTRLIQGDQGSQAPGLQHVSAGAVQKIQFFITSTGETHHRVPIPVPAGGNVGAEHQESKKHSFFSDDLITQTNRIWNIGLSC